MTNLIPSTPVPRSTISKVAYPCLCPSLVITQQLAHHLSATRGPGVEAVGDISMVTLDLPCTETLPPGTCTDLLSLTVLGLISAYKSGTGV